MKIERFIVSHRSGCGICKPECFTSEEDATKYVNSELANFVKMYMQENYNINQDDEADDDMEQIVKDYIQVENNGDGAIVEFGSDYDLISDISFIAWSDWEEFEITTVSIPLTDEEIKSLKGE